MASPELHWADYIVFTSVLLVSAFIGLLYALKSRNASAEEMLTGQRKLPVLPVAFSLSVSFVSAVSVLGIPAEVYANGSDYWMVGFGFFWSLLFVGYVILPKLYKLNITSAYEYLELRFNRPVRLMASAVFLFFMICYMAVVLYAPALALSQVTGLSMEVSILTIGFICTLYTALGGIKAVIWTDVFQTVIITGGLLALLGRGTVEAGGVSQVIEKVVNGSRDATYPMDLNPFIRHTFWTLTIGGGIGMAAIHGGNQATLQRYMGVESLRKSKIVLLLNIPLSEFFLAILCLCGLVMFAYYYGRDPLKSGRISKRDQLLPLFVMDIMGDLPGMPGLFIAAVFSAALSTVSSGVNALATVAVEDFIKPIYLRTRGIALEGRAKSITVVVTALVFGMLTIGAAYLSGLLSSTLLIIVVSIFGMMGGPLLGIILLGLLCPWINSWGAGCALLSSLVICMWTAIGAITRPWPKAMFDNSTNTTVVVNPPRHAVDDWYDLSYQHYATLAVTVCLVVGSLVSFLTSCNRGRALNPGTFYDTLRPCRKSPLQESTFDLEKSPQHNKAFHASAGTYGTANSHI
ncbi:sodium-dependent multivitamin transporter [Aplysia californica]|uniref:Sodium-dependent multivitamin transporter n=1 Tax=Aplysia californica TaxID=6500 RepID=A0ABM0ZUS4_APLCA|nr:sodium-dependent multivitamin transporter [Aplysia californica]